MARIALLASRNGPKSEGLDNLQFVDSDVLKVYDVLKIAPALYDDVQIVQAGKSAQDALSQFEAMAAKSTYSDLLLFYFSGHGQIIRQQLFLIWEDTDLEKPVTTALPISQLKNIFANSKASARIMILDCCRSGGAADSPFGKSGQLASSESLVEAAKEGGSVIIAACSRNAQTRELPELEAGYLTYLFVSALSDNFFSADKDGDGYLSVADFIAWCEEETTRYNIVNLPSEKLEHPELFGKLTGNFFLTSERLIRDTSLSHTIQSEFLGSFKRTLNIDDLTDGERVRQAQVTALRRFLRTFDAITQNNLSIVRVAALHHGELLGLVSEAIIPEVHAYLAQRRYSERSTSNQVEANLASPIYQGQAILTSSGVAETSVEVSSDSIRGGLFTHYFCEALSGRAANESGVVTVKSAYSYICDQMKLQNISSQHPTLSLRGVKDIFLPAKSTSQLSAGIRKAFLYGCNLYKDAQVLPLRFAESDVAKVKDALSQLCPWDSIETLTGRDACEDAIQRTFTSLSLSVQSGDLLFIYLTGHAYRPNGEGRPRLICHDTILGSSGGIHLMKEIEYLISRSKCDIVIAIDTPFSGGVRLSRI